MPFQEHPKTCPICNQGKEFNLIRDFKREQDRFSLYQCSECQVQFWVPLKNPGIEWYEAGSGYKTKDIIKPKVYRAYHKKILETYSSFPENAKVLDLGCGSGEFIKKLQERGCEVWGVDLNRTAIKTAKEYFNLENVFSMDFKDFFKKRDLPKFDIICFFEIIEHLDNPLEFIQNVKKLLKPNARIILSTPCRERMLLNLNTWDFPPHHFTRWNEEAILNIFRKHEFTIFTIKYLEQFKILSESVGGKFTTGLVNRSLNASGKYTIFPKTVHFFGRLKSFAIGTIPAVLLWAFGRVLKRNNGIMLIELQKYEC
ncbi:class I SAM-dependent methyltransferase [Patescibacteria group bacterium]